MATPAALMTEYIERTTRTKTRYLWTDAFAVCNLLALGDVSGATKLVELVHRRLGQHGDAAHPTRGGLRIGKPLPERGEDEPYDERLEWDRDGQYFHYLTKWMHALDQVARVTEDSRYARWSRELADVAFRRFVYDVGPRKRMYWKMSVDLSRPLVTSMGQLDPLDGYVTCLQLSATASAFGEGQHELVEATVAYRAMIDRRHLTTSDPLGIGDLLVDACRLTQLRQDTALRDTLIAAARTGFDQCLARGDLSLPANYRLAFRELGLAIGLSAMATPQLRHARGIAAELRELWSADENRETRAYSEHQDINDVMLATALAPEGFLVLRSRGALAA